MWGPDTEVRMFGSVVAVFYRSTGGGQVRAMTKPEPPSIVVHDVTCWRHARDLRQFWWAQRAPAQEAILEALGWLQEQMAASGTARARA